MKFKINREHFSHGLTQVLNVVGPKVISPILNNVLIEADQEGVKLTTTNLDLGIRVRIKAEVQEPGSITLPVKRLATVVRELPNLEVSFTTANGPKAKLVSGGFSLDVTGLAQDEFPPLEELNDGRVFTLDQSELASMLKSVVYAQSEDRNRYVLNGVFFSFAEGNFSLVATDGRRLAVASKEMEVEGEGGGVTLPTKTLNELVRMLDNGEKVEFSFNDRSASFRIFTNKSTSGLTDFIYVRTKIIEGKYPSYAQVIPKETHERIKLERELFLQCIHRAALVCSDRVNAVTFGLSNNLLEISVENPEVGEARETMAINYSGPDLTMKFNPNFLLEPLRALTQDEVFFELKDQLSPTVLKTLNGFLCVIMPVRN